MPIANAGRNSRHAPGAGSTFEAYERLVSRWPVKQVLAELLSKRWMDALVPLTLLLLVTGVLGTVIEGYFSATNFADAARELTEFSLVTLAMMSTVAAGGVDMSVGSIFALGNLAALWTQGHEWPVWQVILVSVALGATLGLINGALVGLARGRAFLCTLVTMTIYRSLADMFNLQYAGELASLVAQDPTWDFVGSGTTWGIPTTTFALLAIGSCLHLLLTRTRAGWHLLAVGGSRRAARHAGIPVWRNLAVAYALSGALSGIGGCFYAARLASSASDTGVGMEIIALIALVLGGLGLEGGRSGTGRVLIGTLTVLALTNGIVRLGVGGGVRSFTQGLILLLAVTAESKWSKHRHKAIRALALQPTYLALRPCLRPAWDAEPPLQLNRRLQDVQAIGLGELDGPEDVILDREGRLYASVRQGWIWRFSGPELSIREIFARPGGRPLGMAFDAEDNLIVCVSGMGLYGIRPDRQIFKLTDHTNRSWHRVMDDSSLRMADDLDIAPDGCIYFSDATCRYEMGNWMVDGLEGRRNGRLVKYDPATKRTRTVLDRLLFPNGVCLAHDGQSLLFAQTWDCSVSRYWLAGPRAGQMEACLVNLPGYPDNINRASDGNYWLALAGMRSPTYDLAMRSPGFRLRMFRRVAPDEWLFPNLNAGCVLKFSDGGQILDSLWDPEGQCHPAVTSMREDRGWLYLGGILNDRIGRIRLPNADQSWRGPASYWGGR